MGIGCSASYPKSLSELRLQLGNQSLVVRGIAATLSIGQTENAGSICSICQAPGRSRNHKRRLRRLPMRPQIGTDRIASAKNHSISDPLSFRFFGGLPGCSQDTCSPPGTPETSISLASLLAIASAKELKSSTTIRKALGPPITFCR